MLPKGLLKEYSGAFSMSIRLLDMGLVFIVGFLLYAIKFSSFSLNLPYLLALLLGTVLVPIHFSFFNIYTSVRAADLSKHFLHLFQAISMLGFTLAGCAFFAKVGELYSRAWFLSWMLSVLCALILLRGILLFCLRFMRSKGWNERRVIIIGTEELGQKLAQTVQQALWTGFRIVTFMDDAAEKWQAGIHHIPVIKTPANLSDYLQSVDIDEIWLALPLSAEARVKDILYALRHHTITTRFVLDIFGMDLLNHSISEVAGFPVLTIRTTPMMGVNRILKAIEDRMLAAIILLFISPIFLLIALLVKCTSQGPVFFKQHRHGWDGKIIKVYKFRTMYAHEELPGQITQATAGDQRVTPLGRLLRRTSLDELPQFINVLQGRMSIVGPRPHAVAHNEFYKDTISTYMQRHRMKPGITGWAQINGWRGETDTLEKMQKRVEYDLFYINNWSLVFDIKIILLTFFRGFIGRNAY